MLVEYPETKRYPELYERLKTFGICLKNFRFYVFSTGEIVYTDDRHRYSRGKNGNWKIDYESERRAMDAAYGIAEISLRNTDLKHPLRGSISDNRSQLNFVKEVRQSFCMLATI